MVILGTYFHLFALPTARQGTVSIIPAVINTCMHYDLRHKRHVIYPQSGKSAQTTRIALSTTLRTGPILDGDARFSVEWIKPLFFQDQLHYSEVFDTLVGLSMSTYKGPSSFLLPISYEPPPILQLSWELSKLVFKSGRKMR